MNKRASSFFRVDERVFFTMAGICLVSIAVLAFRFTNRTVCKPITLITGDSTMEDHIIHFKAEAAGGKKFSWRFGDGNTAEEETSFATHIYKEAGRYTVTVEVDGACEKSEIVYIKESPVIIDNSMQPRIVSDDTVYVNEMASFSDASPHSTDWEWQFTESGTTDSRIQTPKYTFTTTGAKQILLRVNNKPNLVAYKTILVISREPKNTDVATTKRPRGGGGYKPPPVVYVNNIPVTPILTDTKSIKQPVQQPVEQPKPKAPVLSSEDLQRMLWDVADGKKSPQDFSEYLCGNLSLKISYDGGAISFKDFCAELKKIKKKNIKELSASAIRDNTTNCIEAMTVSVKKKNLFQKIF